ncbi:hypothetical protein [Microbacterium sp.]|uniref:hypothetical protein n=1 Tax=Microbacterium sp. TaxID=51671 RepID=UPI003569FEF4
MYTPPINAAAIAKITANTTMIAIGKTIMKSALSAATTAATLKARRVTAPVAMSKRSAGTRSPAGVLGLDADCAPGCSPADAADRASTCVPGGRFDRPTVCAPLGLRTDHALARPARTTATTSRATEIQNAPKATGLSTGKSRKRNGKYWSPPKIERWMAIVPTKAAPTPTTSPTRSVSTDRTCRPII